MSNFEKARQIIPQQLLDEIERGNCIPFIGAGVTAEADVGIPSGWELAQLIAHECVERSNNQLKFDDIKQEGLERLADRFLSIVESDPAKRDRGRPELDSFLQHNIPARGRRQSSLGVSSFPFLVNVPWQKNRGSIIITTNWDEMIEDAVEKYAKKDYDQITKDEHISKLRLDPAKFKIIKFHGTIKETKELLITQTQFDQLLAMFFTSQLYAFLAQSFVTRTIVFVGYGLQDQTFRLVNALITKIVNEPGYKRLQPHYAIMGDAPDPFMRDHWRNLGIDILPLKARDFFKYVYSETNQFVNRDEQRKLDRLQDEPLCAFVGPAGVGKSYLLRRIANDLSANNGETVHSYPLHLFYKFPVNDHLSPEDRCIDFLNTLAKKVGVILENYHTGLDKNKYISSQTQSLRDKLLRSCLLLIDCSGKLQEVILGMLDTLLENAQVAVGFNAMAASRSPLDWKGTAKRVFKRNTEWLLPFTKGHIALCLKFQALLEADSYLDKSDLDICTSEIYGITRGHPQAIKIVLERLSEKADRLRSGNILFQYLRDNAKELNDEIVKNVVLKEVLSEVKNQSFIEILQDVLCIFRKTNTSIIQDMIKSKFWKKDWENIFKSGLPILYELQVYYIAKLPPAGTITPPIYFVDPVIRRIFSQHIRNNDLDRFVETNAFAAEMHAKLVKDFRDEWQRTYIIESLFHKLHSMGKPTARGQFDDICASLQGFIAILSSAETWLNRSELCSRLKQEIEADQEFMDDFIDKFGEEGYDNFIEMIQ